jgi:CheY-like chemotaxis protein
LVVDDSALNRRMLIKLLENRGHRCDEARHGREGVEKVEQRLRLLEASTHEEGSTRNVPHVVAGTNMAVPDTAVGAAAPGTTGPSAGGGEAKGGDGIDHRDEMAAAHGNGARATLAPPSPHDTPRAHRAQAPSGPYDVILIDYVMPVLDGPTACAEMRELGHTGMIIGVTGNVAPSDIEFFQSRGANTVLTKPLSMDAFNAAVRSYAQALMSGSALESRDELATAGHKQGATATP